MTEAVESISGLITRYTVFEMLYLHEDCESTPKLYKSLRELYAAILRYLSKVRGYFSGNSIRTSSRLGGGTLPLGVRVVTGILTYTSREIWPRAGGNDAQTVR
jgi:hypothetical protein